jgi:predicted ferric reductase
MANELIQRLGATAQRPRPGIVGDLGCEPDVVSRRAARRRVPLPMPLAVDTLAGLLGVGLGITVGLGVSTESWSALSAPGGWLTAGGRITGLLGTYLLLVTVLLAGRVPVVERTLGQDRLLRWHRRLAPWALVLIAAHGVLITAGYAQTARSGLLHQFGVLLGSYSGVLAATVAFLLLLGAGFTSARIARRRMRYETWWTVHLYTYLALALSFSHQLATGAAFVGHPFARAWWIGVWLATAGAVLLYRVGLPLWRSLFHQLRVVSVEPVAPGVVSVTCRGRGLRLLPLAGGQFFQWRFLERGMWWQAHPYSVSALADPPYLRFTVRDLGDHSRSLSHIQPGTRVAIEGPYGAFTAGARRTDRLVLIGAGVGVTPLRALLEDLPVHVDVAMLVRAHSAQDLVLRDEIETLIDARGGQLFELVGPREKVPLTAQAIRRMVPDIAERDVYVCGPTGFTSAVRDAARVLGVPSERVHHETFTF